MLPRMTSYTPSLYQPDSYGRYRHYPHTVETPIPGAGYHVGDFFWGEQELNLDGSTRPQPYGTYSLVPLRGLGQMQFKMPTRAIDPRAQKAIADRLRSQDTSSDAPEADWSNAQPEDQGFPGADEVASEIAAAQEAADRAAQEAAADAAAAAQEPSFFMRKAGPVPYWAIGLLGLGVLGGGGYYLWRRRR
jgi:hypothetical protein